MQPVSCNTLTAYKWGEGGVGWPLVDTDGLLVFEETMAPGCIEKRHYHKKATQCFYILEGTALMKVDGQNIVLVQDMALHIQPETDHAIANEMSNEIRFLVISAPSTRSDRHEIGVKK
tara:strand:+ start:168 stop:521 length:354 start_codon:yes stop_codon:yes gene_type:complete